MSFEIRGLALLGAELVGLDRAGVPDAVALGHIRPALAECRARVGPCGAAQA